MSFFAWASIAATIGSLFGRYWWPLELLCHFRVQIGGFQVVSCIALLALRYRKTAVLAGLSALLNLAFILPLYWGDRPPTQDTSVLRVLALNVLRMNRNRAEVVRIVRQSGADIVVLLEPDQTWQEELTPLKSDYPYRQAHIDDVGNFGLVVFSREPMHHVRFVRLAGYGTEAIEADMMFAQKQVRVIGAHPAPPMGRRLATMRNHQLRHLVRLASEHTGPTILLGDLNVTSWSPYFGDLLRHGGLVDSRRGFGILTSYQCFPLFRIPIDHILVSPDIRVRRRWVVPCHGSDHDAVLADLAVEPGT